MKTPIFLILKFFQSTLVQTGQHKLTLGMKDFIHFYKYWLKQFETKLYLLTFCHVYYHMACFSNNDHQKLTVWNVLNCDTVHFATFEMNYAFAWWNEWMDGWRQISKKMHVIKNRTDPYESNILSVEDKLEWDVITCEESKFKTLRKHQRPIFCRTEINHANSSHLTLITTKENIYSRDVQTTAF